VNAYVLSLAVLLMTGAALGDRFGRKRLFVAGMGLFVIGSAACALASAAFAPARRARALGIFGAVTGLGVVLGPLVGGAAVQGIS